jgi:DNA-binding NtrC family response regulator
LLEKEDFALIVCDAELPDDGWKSLLSRGQSLPCPARLIVFCRYCEVALWADVLRLGAYDLLMYPFDTQESAPDLRARVAGLGAGSRIHLAGAPPFPRICASESNGCCGC